MSEGDAVIEQEGRSDGDGEFAHTRLVGIRKPDHGQFGVLRVNLDHREIGLDIYTTDLGFILTPILEPDQNLFRAVHDVAIREDVTFLADDHA